MSFDALLVMVFVILPGYVCLRVLRFMSADDDVSTWETIARSLVLSIVSATLLWPLACVWEPVDDYWTHFLRPGNLTSGVPVGLVVHTASAMLVGIVFSTIITSDWMRRWRRSVFLTAWDWMWFQISKEDRYLVIETQRGTYHGALAFADNPRKGNDLLIRNPNAWLDDQNRWQSTGMEFILLKESQIISIQVSKADAPNRNDKEVES